MKIGLLPLYLKLYDDACPFMRPRIEAFRETIAGRLAGLGFGVAAAPVCTLKAEFAEAVAMIEGSGAAAIVTLHLSYSPSLECIDALAATRLPLLVFDTTESYEFGASVNADEIMYNHGIHGVQDMCNLLIRRGKSFKVFAGHYERSDALRRIADYCRGLEMAAAFRGMRVGLVGKPFDGMGDFAVPFDELKEKFGIEVIGYDFDAAAERIAAVTAEEIESERRADAGAFDWDDSVTGELYERSARVCIAVRQWMRERSLSALTVNFLAAQKDSPGLPIMPFTECGKAMARGAGYAGEGDVLTAALCGAVLRAFPETTFTEMFCPDWRGGSVFMSHMGEYNYNIGAGRPRLTEKDFPYTTAENPAVAYGTYMPGKATLVNLAPRGGGAYALIAAHGEILEIRGENRLSESVSGWFKPDAPLAEFLEKYSLAGGTHHSALSYAASSEAAPAFAAFAEAMGFEYIEI